METVLGAEYFAGLGTTGFIFPKRDLICPETATERLVSCSWMRAERVKAAAHAMGSRESPKTILLTRMQV